MVDTYPLPSKLGEDTLSLSLSRLQTKGISLSGAAAGLGARGYS